MRIFIAGGTGFLGSALSRQLAREGHTVTILSRFPPRGGTWPESVAFMQGDPTRVGAWQDRVREAEVVFNFAGAPIFHRWTRRYKELIRTSRLESTARMVEAMPVESNGPRRLINASAVGYYGFRGDERLREDAGRGVDFLAEVSADWEAEALQARTKGVRVVVARLGIVLGRKSGALRAMMPAFRMGIGGRLGDGRQWFPWIHVDDVVRALVFLMTAPEADGPFNLCAPEPVTQGEFARRLGAVLHRPAFMPAPEFLIRGLGGEFGENLLHGQRAVPEKLRENGFEFQFPALDVALRDLLGR